jgi:hypothetical protein
VDGNGRLARAMAHWLLDGAGYRLVGDPQKYCRVHKAAYYQALAIRSGLPPHAHDPRPWHAFFAGLVSECYQSPGSPQFA